MDDNNIFSCDKKLHQSLIELQCSLKNVFNFFILIFIMTDSIPGRLFCTHKRLVPLTELYDFDVSFQQQFSIYKLLSIERNHRTMHAIAKKNPLWVFK